MKHLKTYGLFESKIGLTPDQEAFLNQCTRGTWSYNPATGLVDVKGDFNFSGKRLSDFVGVKFGKVSGDFDCDRNYLTSLEGAPQEVGGEFDCSDNQLTSLAGGPKVVGGGFRCDDNSLTSLAGAPQKVGRHFYCHRNQLTSLEGAPQEVSGGFSCSYNQLTSLAGGPKVVGGGFSCSYNQLTSLAGGPQEVDGDFHCHWNQLTSLAGAPQVVSGTFKCDAFELEKGEWNLEGWLKVLQEGSPKAQKLILTILSAEALNKEIQKDPAGMIMKLKGVWNDETFKKTRAKLVWPKGFGEEADLVGGLNSIGF